MLESQQKFIRMCDEMFSKAGFEAKVIYETLNWDTVYNLVSGGVGIGFIPEILTKREKNSHVRIYRIADQHALREYSVAFVKGHQLTYFENVLIDIVSEAVKSSRS